MNSASDLLRYGIIGCGMMGREHIGNILALDDAEITALADPHEPSIATALAGLGQAARPETFSDHRDLLASGLCDVVVIASPNHTHHQLLLDALAAPVHILVEKPLGISVAQGREVFDVHAAGPPDGMDHRVVWMGLEYRYMPPTQRLIAEVDGGVAGDVHMVAIREHRYPFLPKIGDWNRFNRNTGGTFVEKCCHFFDLMGHVARARPQRVYASGAQSVNHLDESYDGEVPDVIDNAFVVVDYENGVRGLLDLCMFAEASRNEQEMSVVGSAAKIEAFTTESFVRIARRADGHHVSTDVPVEDPSIRFLGGHNGSSYLQHAALDRAIRSGSAPEVTLLDGLWAVAVGVAAHRSIDEGRPVEMHEFPELAGLPPSGTSEAAA